MSEGISHWAEKLEIGDKCLATIRHKTDGTKNLHNVEVIVIDNDWGNKEIHAWFPEYKVVIPYNELKQKDDFDKDRFSIPLQNHKGHGTFIGDPSAELIDAVNKMADLAYKKLKPNEGEATPKPPPNDIV